MKRRVSIHIKKHPKAKIYNLGEGDPTQPIVNIVTKAMVDKINRLHNGQDFLGYTDPLGTSKMRFVIKDYYNLYTKQIGLDEIFLNDGAKADLFNIQTIFAPGMTVALQSPSYPGYIDSLIINGNSKNIVFLDGNPDNNFIPPIPSKKVDILYLCFPNNPTGACATTANLKQFVSYALRNDAIIIYDSVYNWFIQGSDYPKSIYQIPGAEKCAIEIQSLSKLASFASIRLGWTIVPKSLLLGRFRKGQINSIWRRRQQAAFNGPSIISQAGAIAALSPTGLKENKKHIIYYMENTKLIKETFEKLGFECYGGMAPYVWLKTPRSMKSWDFFDLLLEKTDIICTPGIGFGPLGEGFFRLSGLSTREDTEKALDKLVKFWLKFVYLPLPNNKDEIVSSIPAR